MKGFKEDYKVELIEELPEGETISFYKQGNFTDLCRGPHLPSTGKIKAFRLTSIAGAYWRGDEHNKMLTRIYGTAFAKKDEMEAYFTMLEEAKKRDHTKLGKELKLFTILNEGKGLPFFLPPEMVTLPPSYPARSPSSWPPPMPAPYPSVVAVTLPPRMMISSPWGSS